MATIVEINERLVEKATAIAERVLSMSVLYENDKWVTELVLRLQSVPHISNLLGSGKLGGILDKVSGGGSQAIQWILDTYLELRLSCFENEAEWDFWCQYLLSVHTKTVPNNTGTVLPNEIAQSFTSNKTPKQTLDDNPWVLVLFVFPQMRLRIETKKKK